jgi:hypothetical protein
VNLPLKETETEIFHTLQYCKIFLPSCHNTHTMQYYSDTTVLYVSKLFKPLVEISVLQNAVIRS